MTQFPNDFLREAIRSFQTSETEIRELRALGVKSADGKPIVVAGWFDDPDKLLQAAQEIEQRQPTGIYITLNPVERELLVRSPNRLVDRPRSTTADRDISRRVWLPIDIDPVRPSGTNADPCELLVARTKALEVADWLLEQLGAEPDIWGFSGNGYHLLYRIDMPNDAESTRLVKSVLIRASDRFNDGEAKVDRSVSNPARIWKLYGTTARKGAEVAEENRVHRLSRILERRFANDQYAGA